MKIYVATCVIPQNYYGDDMSIIGVSESREQIIQICRDYPANLHKYVDISVWVDGKETMEFVNFELDTQSP